MTPRSADDLLLAELNAPPDLDDGIESLRYWRDRRARLAWYRVRARREAAVMASRWERRVRAALFTQRGVSLGVRASAALLLGGLWMRRLPLKRAALVIGMVATLTLMLPLVALVVLLQQL